MTIRIDNNLRIEDVSGPKISFDVEEVSRQVGPELNPDAESYSIVGRGSRAHDSPEDAVKALQEDGLYIYDSEDGHSNRVKLAGINIVENEEPSANVNEFGDLIEHYSEMSFTGYRHEGGRLANGDSVEEALQEINGEPLSLVGDIENYEGEHSAQAGYTSGTTFGYRQGTGELTLQEQATLDAAVEKVLKIDDVTKEGGF